MVAGEDKTVTKEEAEKVIDRLKSSLAMGGTKIELVGVEGSAVKVKLHCPETKFKVKGEIVTFEDLAKKEVEKHITANLKGATVVFV